MAVVYQHNRRSTGEPFYIGIGKSKKRAYSKVDRSKHWHYIVAKEAYDVIILYEDLSWEDACKIESQMIEKIGRRDKGKGSLINLTDGGEGTAGLIRPLERTARILETKAFNGTLQHSELTKQKISKALKGKPKSESHKLNNSLCRKGKPQSEDSKQRRSDTMKGMIIARAICPHCSKEGALNGLKRYHFENCKQKLAS